LGFFQFLGLALPDPGPPPRSGAVLVTQGWLPSGGSIEIWRDPGKAGERLREELRRRNRAALATMISLARARAPVDTGRLLNGIAGTEKGDMFEFRASAIAPGGEHEDYARFDEFGHAIAGGEAVRGGPRVVDEAFFAGNGAWNSHRRARADAVEPRPFFFDSAGEGLATRGTPLEILDAAMAGGTGSGA
jgi:hypothetical protein